MVQRELVKKYGEPHSGKVIGSLYVDGIYETDRVPKLHFFVKFRGYGISTWILRDLKANGCAYVDVFEHRANGQVRVLRSEISKWFSSNAFDFTWAGDEQKILPLEAMEDKATRRLWRPGG